MWCCSIFAVPVSGWTESSSAPDLADLCSNAWPNLLCAVSAQNDSYGIAGLNALSVALTNEGMYILSKATYQVKLNDHLACLPSSSLPVDSMALPRRVQLCCLERLLISACCVECGCFWRIADARPRPL